MSPKGEIQAADSPLNHIKDHRKEIVVNSRGVQFLVLTSFVSLAMSCACHAQVPSIPGGQKNLPRLPDDQIEGTIWEYSGKPKGETKEGEKTPKLEGRFRTEGKAIMDVSRELPIPPKEEVKKVIEKVKDGELSKIKLPPAPQVKRLGEYRKISGGKLRLDFNDKESLNGIMIIWPKKETSDVWLGTYTEKLDGKTVREWIVEVRPIED